MPNVRFSAEARKYLVALVGIAALVALDYFKINIPGVPDIVRNILVGLFVSEGVYQASNQ